MNEQVFKLENGLSLRVPFINNETAWFIAPEVCEILGYSNPTKAIEDLDEDERNIVKLSYKGQERDVNVISESGLYCLILSSSKPNAKEFRKWVTSEVLPSIRKAGKYTTEKAQQKQMAMKQISDEIGNIESNIDNLRKKTKELNALKDEKYRTLRAYIEKDDNQLEIEF